MKQFLCDCCGWIYHEKFGAPQHGVAPGTRIEELPVGFECPSCGCGPELWHQDSRDFGMIGDKKKTKEEYLAYLIAKNNKFSDDQFNTDKYSGKFYEPMIGPDALHKEAPYGKPSLYPTAGKHPRFLITEDDLPKIKSFIAKGESEGSDYKTFIEEFRSLANSDEDQHHYGVFSEVEDSLGQIYRYDGKILAMIEAKALTYLLTGDKTYAYEAIISAKNAMLSLVYNPKNYHGPSNVMVTVAAVYDWCYDVLTDADKQQMIWGTAQILAPRLEGFAKYPPSRLQGVNSHTTGPQLLRDWMSVATAFADEAPDWWEYVAGAYFNVYLPVANEMFKNGWTASGTIIYGAIKVLHQAQAAYLVKKATGESVLIDDAKNIMRFFMSHLTTSEGENIYFEMGDGFSHPGGTPATQNLSPYIMFAALYNDPVLFAEAKYLSNNFTRYHYDFHTTFSPAHTLCLVSVVDYNGESMREGIPPIQYFAEPATQMTARERWGDPNATAVLMKIGNLTTFDHDVFDHGSFQIYHKGLLAGISGPYNFGTNAHFYYRKSTVSSNGLLVFNPANADAEYTGNNAERYFYSGGQLQKKVATGSVGEWLESAQMARGTGASYGYKEDGSAKYAYIAGDLTVGYDPDTVKYIGRQMLTFFTENKDFPTLFFTFDQIVSRDKSFTKHWLLHTLKEPKIDQDNLTATIINGEGKMYLESLFGADSIVKIGGEGKAWWINGYFADPNNKGSWNAKTQDFDDPDDKGSWIEGKANNDENVYNGTMNWEKIWGRIELRTEGLEYSKLLTVMAVTDAENSTTFEIQKFKSDDNTVYGAKFESSVVAFLNSDSTPEAKRFEKTSFETDGEGLLNYYIAGIEEGTWQISVNGALVCTSFSEKDSSFLTFTAPAGMVTLTPVKDVDK